MKSIHERICDIVAAYLLAFDPGEWTPKEDELVDEIEKLILRIEVKE